MAGSCTHGVTATEGGITVAVRAHRRAFTLIELLVVVTIIGVLIAVLLPAVQRVRESANRVSCQNNLKQIGLALHHYHDAQQSFPPGYQSSLPCTDGATDTAPGWGWGAFILPYFEQDTVYRQLDLAQPVQNSPAIQTLVRVYVCPSDVAPNGAFPVLDGFGNTVCQTAPSSYAACVGGDESETTAPTGLGVFYRDARTRLTDVTDGTSETILVGERAWSNANGVWAGAIPDGVILRGPQNPCQPVVPGAWFPAATLVQAHAHLNNAASDPDGSAGMDDFSSRHPGGSNFLFANGSVHFLRSVPDDNPDGSYTADGLIFQALGTRPNGEVVPTDWVD